MTQQLPTAWMWLNETDNVVQGVTLDRDNGTLRVGRGFSIRRTMF